MFTVKIITQYNAIYTIYAYNMYFSHSWKTYPKKNIFVENRLHFNAFSTTHFVVYEH